MERYYRPVPKRNRESIEGTTQEPQMKFTPRIDDRGPTKGACNSRESIGGTPPEPQMKFTPGIGDLGGPTEGACNRASQHHRDSHSQRRSLKPAAASDCWMSGNPYGVCLRISLDCARYLLRQGIPFYHLDPSYTWDKGHFLEMVDWYKGFDEKVRHAFDEVDPERCSELSSRGFQKDLVNACAEETMHVILEEVGDSRFSILIDDTHDISSKERMGIILRFVNNQGKVIERFLGLEWVKDTTPTAIKESLVGFLVRHGLSLSRIRGQGYHGQSNMREEFNNVQRQIQDEYPFAFYVHCFACQLEQILVYVSSSSSSAISYFFYNVSVIVNATSASCMTKDAEKRRQAILEKLEIGEISKTDKHQEVLGETRWGSPHTTLNCIDTMWDSVLEVLMIVAEHGCRDSRASVSIETMESFEFVFILKLMLKLFAIMNELSLVLQSKDKDMVQFVGLLVDVNERLETLRANDWEALFEDVKTFCDANEILVPNMDEQIPSMGHSRLNGITVSQFHYYHDQIFFAAIDSIRTEIAHRFNDGSMDLLVRFSCLDPRRNFSQFDVDKIAQLTDIYSEDFLEDDHAIIKGQLEGYIFYVRRHDEFASCHDIASLAAKMVETKQHLIFPLVYRLIELALLLPVVKASVERISSAINIIPTEMCNEIPIDWLSDFAVYNIEEDISKELDAERILERFQSMVTQRME